MPETRQHNPCLGGNIMKHTMMQTAVHLVPEQPAYAVHGGAVALAENGRAVAIGGFVDSKVHIQITVIVVIKKTGHGGLYMNIQAIRGSHVFKMGNPFFVYALVNVQD